MRFNTKGILVLFTMTMVFVGCNHSGDLSEKTRELNNLGDLENTLVESTDKGSNELEVVTVDTGEGTSNHTVETVKQEKVAVSDAPESLVQPAEKTVTNESPVVASMSHSNKIVFNSVEKRLSEIDNGIQGSFYLMNINGVNKEAFITAVNNLSDALKSKSDRLKSKAYLLGQSDKTMFVEMEKKIDEMLGKIGNKVTSTVANDELSLKIINMNDLHIMLVNKNNELNKILN
ncbi:hypothetical protein DB313_04670 (plasmid) [Borrelia turcica IST7]|uniref:Lipoprotein n=1 Tax=Borrelia turcica IST7 TaxID=1104446 RepID=A0A386PNT8_9SPIR|nr:hypothetical protein [Borrelia turcica]AYE36795.1 hypothetical protein DB313_04670 [Borrelia turcica IST7]